MGDQLTLRGELIGHGGWVTAIATTSEDPNMILSSSRDKVVYLFVYYFCVVLCFLTTLLLLRCDNFFFTNCENSRP